MLKTQSSNIQQNFILNTFLLILLLLASSISFAAKTDIKVGKIVSISGQVTASLKNQQNPDVRTLKRGSVINQGDIIQSTKGASAKIRFTDTSTMLLKDDTKLVINDYLYDQDKTKSKDNKFIASMSGQYLQVVSGNIKKEFKLQTPTATLGIRGTIYDVINADHHSTTVILREGAINITSNSGQTITLDQNRPTAIVKSNGEISLVGDTGAEAKIDDQVRTEPESDPTLNLAQEPAESPTISESFVNSFTGNGSDIEGNDTQGNQAAHTTGVRNIISRE